MRLFALLAATLLLSACCGPRYVTDAPASSTDEAAPISSSDS